MDSKSHEYKLLREVKSKIKFYKQREKVLRERKRREKIIKQENQPAGEQLLAETLLSCSSSRFMSSQSS